VISVLHRPVESAVGTASSAVREAVVDPGTWSLPKVQRPQYPM